MVSKLPNHPTYKISMVYFHGIQLCPGRNINKTISPIFTREENKEAPEASPVQSKDNLPPIPPKKPRELEKKQNPPYLERLSIDKLMPQSEFDLLGELHNVCLKILLFQAILDIPIYSKVVRELCLKKLGIKRKDTPTVHVTGYLA